jgi:C-terminal processing protease CtpA/Prc
MIIDLRNNGGGSADLVQFVYSYLDSSGYCTPNNVVWKSSELSQLPLGFRERFFPKRFEKKVLVDEDRKSYYQALRSPINTLDTIYMKNAKKANFVCEGNVNVLMNAGTASASVDFAHIIKERKRGALIGSPCNGGMTGTWGNAKLYILPITGIGYSISTIRYNYNRDFKYDLNPIQPDIEFKLQPDHFEWSFDLLLEDLLENGLKVVH